MKRSIENVESDLETLEWNRLKEQASRKEDFWSLCFAVNNRFFFRKTLFQIVSIRFFQKNTYRVQKQM